MKKFFVFLISIFCFSAQARTVCNDVRVCNPGEPTHCRDTLGDLMRHTRGVLIPAVKREQEERKKAIVACDESVSLLVKEVPKFRILIREGAENLERAQEDLSRAERMGVRLEAERSRFIRLSSIVIRRVPLVLEELRPFFVMPDNEREGKIERRIQELTDLLETSPSRENQDDLEQVLDALNDFKAFMMLMGSRQRVDEVLTAPATRSEVPQFLSQVSYSIYQSARYSTDGYYNGEEALRGLRTSWDSFVADNKSDIARITTQIYSFKEHLEQLSGAIRDAQARSTAKAGECSSLRESFETKRREIERMAAEASDAEHRLNGGQCEKDHCRNERQCHEREERGGA